MGAIALAAAVAAVYGRGSLAGWAITALASLGGGSPVHMVPPARDGDGGAGLPGGPK